MSKAKIKVSDFEGCEFENQLASSYSKSGSKRLIVYFRLDSKPTAFHVRSQGVVVKETADLAEAIEAYNDAP